MDIETSQEETAPVKNDAVQVSYREGQGVRQWQSNSILTVEHLLRCKSEKVSKKDGVKIAQKLFLHLDAHNKRNSRKLTYAEQCEFEKSGNDPRRFGSGLSAPQIGIFKRVAVIDCGGTRMALINPRITNWSNNKVLSPEGCLSMPDTLVDTYRYTQIKVECDNLPAQTFGITNEEVIADPTPESHKRFFLCKCVQHEIAHLYGKLHVDFTNEQYPTPDEWENWE